MSMFRQGFQPLAPIILRVLLSKLRYIGLLEGYHSKQWLSMTEVFRELAKVLVKAPLNGWNGRVFIACSPGKVYVKLFTSSCVGLVDRVPGL